jgi:hypothetical protein
MLSARRARHGFPGNRATRLGDQNGSQFPWFTNPIDRNAGLDAKDSCVAVWMVQPANRTLGCGHVHLVSERRSLGNGISVFPDLFERCECRRIRDGSDDQGVLIPHLDMRDGRVVVVKGAEKDGNVPRSLWFFGQDQQDSQVGEPSQPCTPACALDNAAAFLFRLRVTTKDRDEECP